MVDFQRIRDEWEDRSTGPKTTTSETPLTRTGLRGMNLRDQEQALSPRKGGLTEGPPKKQLRQQDLLTALQTVQGLEELLTDEKTLPQGQTLLAHAQKELDVYEQRFARAPDQTAIVQEAMRMAAVVKTVAGQMARGLGNPWLAPELAVKVLEYYGPDVRDALQKKRGLDKDTSGEALTLAKVLVSADPLLLFVTDKIEEGDASRKVVEMARAAGKTGAEMLSLLTMQLQMHLGSFDRDEIRQGTIGEGTPHGGKSLSGESDLIGELSSGRFERLVALDKEGETEWTEGKEGENRLAFRPGTEEKLARLGRAVKTAWDLSERQGTETEERPKVDDPHLSEGQQHYLGGIEKRDADQMKLSGDEMMDELRLVLQAQYEIDAGGADRLISAYRAAFPTIPLTISFSAGDMFGEEQDGELVYLSALKREVDTRQLDSLLPEREDGKKAEGSIETIGREDGMSQHRDNSNYMRWRYEKDTKPEGYSELKTEELPEFGALSPSFAIAQGTQNDSKHGKNQYGTSHFVFRDDVKARAAFQFTAKGVLRRDPLLLLHDIAVAAPGKLTAARRRVDEVVDLRELVRARQDATEEQKQQAERLVTEAEAELYRARTKATQASNVQHSLMLNIASQKEAFLDQQQIEVQIFGAVNVGADVREIELDPAESKTVARNTRSFAKGKGIAVKETARTEDTKVHSLTQPERSQPVTDAVQEYVSKDPELVDAETTFDSYAKQLLGLEVIAQRDLPYYDFLHTQLTRAWSKMGWRAKHKGGRKAVLEKVKAHNVQIRG